MNFSIKKYIKWIFDKNLGKEILNMENSDEINEGDLGDTIQ